MKFCKIDLHVHTVLSPCGDLMMTPGNIINKALKEDIEVLAITDHNTAENIATIMKMAESTPLHIIPGMEVETREEVHILCLFETLEQILEWQQVIYKHLPDKNNIEDIFGPQIIVDENDQYTAKLDRLLATATNLSINEVVKKVEKRKGLVIPSHIDKNNGLIKNLGIIPENLEIKVMEIFHKTNIEAYINKFPFLQEKILIKNSDSHYLKEINPKMALELEEVSFKEVIKVLKEKKNRKLFL